MILHTTKKLAEKLNISPLVEPVTDDIFSWRANYVQNRGCRFVVFMNDASRFTVIINDAKAAKLKKLPELFIETLRETLFALGVNPEVAERYIAESGDITYSKNADRKRTAQLNKNADTALYSLRNYTNDVELSVCASRAKIFSVNDYFVPGCRMIELLGRYGLPVRKFRALDLNVRLDLGGADAVRRLRVPAGTTFVRLHKLLQEAFSWKNCHLYSFGLFKEWRENYAQPDIELVLEPDLYDADETSRTAKPIAGAKLSDYVPEYCKILYLYDFGDGWHHYIEVENIIDDCGDELPILLSGDGDSPPEDVGGAGGFAEFLKIIADPEHEDYDHTTEWANSQWWKPFDFEMTARRFKSML